MHLPILSGIKFRTLGLMACLLAPVLGLAEAKVGILFHEQDSYWKFAATLLEQNANDKKLSATAKALPTGAAEAAQSRAIRAFTGENAPAVLIVNPAAAKLYQTELTSIAASGTKLIVLTGPAPTGLKHIQIGTPPAGLDNAGAWLFSPIVKDSTEIAILGSAGNDQEKKALEVLQFTHPKAIVRQVEAKPGEPELSVVNRLLAQYPKVAAVYATTEEYTNALLKGLKEKNRLGKVQVVGCGVMLPREIEKAISKNHIAGWVAQQPAETCAKAIETAVALINGGKSVPPVIPTPQYQTITKANLEDMRVQQLLQ